MLPLMTVCLLSATPDLVEKILNIFPEGRWSNLMCSYIPTDCCVVISRAAFSLFDKNGHIPLHFTVFIERFAWENIIFMVKKTLQQSWQKVFSITPLLPACHYKIAWKRLNCLLWQCFYILINNHCKIHSIACILLQWFSVSVESVYLTLLYDLSVCQPFFYLPHMILIILSFNLVQCWSSLK